jgi:PPM family protein phosphatase
MGIIIEAAAGTDMGRLRDLNEDMVLARIGPGGALLAVADGMGGHQAGEVASQLALSSLQEALHRFIDALDDPPPTTAERQLVPDKTKPGITNQLAKTLRAAVTIANKKIYDYALDNQEEAGNMGCTLTAALIRSELMVIANIGDSRAYMLRDGSLEQLTEDHSYVGQLVRAGQLAPESVYDHPQRNVITRALGHQFTVKPDIRTHALQPGDQLLICSDGLWEMLRETVVITAIMSEAPDLETAVAQLINAANSSGGYDNIGLVVAKAMPEDKKAD